MTERRESRTVEDLLIEGPPLEWYYGIGRTDTGITDVHYSGESFREAYNGELSYHLSRWAHIGAAIPREEGSQLEQVERFTPIIEQMHEHARRVYKLSGFWPEEITAKCSALWIIFRGQKSAPFQVTLVEPSS